jgi:cyanuric acid amidohydrolase
MAYSRGASALGVAVALGEIGDEHVLRNYELFSSVASTSAGIELMHNVVIVLGNSAASRTASCRNRGSPINNRQSM